MCAFLNTFEKVRKQMRDQVRETMHEQSEPVNGKDAWKSGWNCRETNVVKKSCVLYKQKHVTCFTIFQVTGSLPC